MKPSIEQGLMIGQPFLMASILIFAIGSILFLAIIISSRIIKTYRFARREVLRDKLQREINSIIFSKDGSRSAFPWNFHLNSIRYLMRSAQDRQLMIDIIVGSKKNLLGHYADTLRKLYIRLGLKRFSVKKLSHRNNLVKINGLQELAQMEIDDALPLMKDMFFRCNIRVREELFVTMVRLGSPWPFSVISKYKEPIAGWIMVVIHKHLSTLPIHQLPKFYEWLISPNPSVKIFALEMIKQFHQLEAINALATLLRDEDQDLAVKAADVLSELGVHQYADEIAELGRNNMHHEKRTICIIKSLGRIGNENHKSYLAFHMIHGPYRVRFEATRALLKLKISILDQCIDFNINHDGEFDGLYKHLTDPLLR